MDEVRCRELFELVRNVRHDASGPLTAALGHLQLALEDPALSSGELRETVRLAEAELRRLAEILRRLHALRGPSGGAPAA